MTTPTIAALNPVKERMRAGDVALGMIVRLARSGDVARVLISADGGYVVFDSQATNLYAGDTNGATDVFGARTAPAAGRITRRSPRPSASPSPS